MCPDAGNVAILGGRTAFVRDDQSMALLEDLVHGSSCTLVVPAVLLVAAATLCVYRQMTEDATDLPLTGFLVSIFVA
ncbi:hypothetical protein AK812_SmicGene38564 [Symbiodinium microadriaticum]|uniref:Uncharacterized protein n=1 Tax=Symbiodinium microadriaticum TaxID=2951 RepID=A0A1Q9CDH2_SYMMI|nr:hypothetical protein AK812_SmicGene38564 [Symbiodinium microadriaticum]